MASITSPGIGSGLDIAGIVQQLVAAERAPAESRIARQEAQAQAELSALGTLKSALSGFLDALDAMRDLDELLVHTASSGNEELFTASAGTGAVPARYEVEVLELAQAHKLVSGAFTASDATVGTGTLTIAVGNASFSIEIAEGQGTLAGIRDAINAAAGNTGVAATIVNAADGSHLVLTAEETGSENVLTVTAELGDGGLAALAYDPGNGVAGLAEIAAAADARLLVDGFEVVSSSNSVTGVIDGVTIELVAAAPGEPADLVVANDESAVQATIKKFTDAWNELVAQFDKLTAFDPASGIAAPLQGDASVRAMQMQLRRELGVDIGSADLPFGMLSEIGIQTDVDGKLTLDDAKLAEALAEDFRGVGQLFANPDGGFAVRLHGLVEDLLASDGMVATRTDGLNDHVESLNEQREALDLRLAALEERLLRQFNALDSLLGQLAATSNYLAQQLANLPTYTARQRD
jgi:flagellar hook-associated protein 2